MNQQHVRRWVVRGTATLVAVLVAAGTIGAAHVVELPGLAARPAGRTVTPVPADAQRVCAGSLLQLGDASGSDATTASRIGRETVAAASSSGPVHRSTLADASSGGSSPTVVTARAGRTTPTVVGSGIQEADGTDVAGLAAAACDDPSSSAWLVGGSTVTGRTSLVTLSNPTDVNATVDLDVYTTTGRVSAPGTTGIVVAPNTQKVVPLAGFVADAPSPVVHVTSSGGQVVATMQESVVRTLTPGGADIVQAAAAPSTTQTIAGVVLRDTDAAQAGDDTSDAAPIVRVFVPGTATAHLTLAFTTPQGGGTTVQATADGGVVTDVPLDDFVDGRYSVTVTSDVPVVAGARTSTPTTDGRTDLAWSASAPTLTGTTLLDVADGPSARLTLVNPTTHDATVTVAGGGTRSTVTVAAGTTADTAVPTSTRLTLRGVRGLVAGVSYVGSSGIAGFPVRPGATASTPITVYP